MSDELDPAASEALFEKLLTDVRDHYRRRPQTRTSVYEAMQALAWTVGQIVAVDPVEARAWFDSALDRAIDEALEDPAQAEGHA